MLASLTREVKQYLVITGSYWAFTLTDGALRMLVVLHFHQLGYDALEIALLFLFYEFFGVVTNLVGGWLGARIGLNRTMHIGLGMQIVALSMLLVPPEMLTVAWVMSAQALSGIAKDLNKMSAKSSVKTLIPADAQGQLFRWVAILTGSKNALKGVGFFLGGALLALIGFSGAVLAMAVALTLVWLLSLWLLQSDLGKAKYKPKFTEIFSKNRQINQMSAARLFLFASRDVWFVVALPVYLSSQLNWSVTEVGSFMALWIIGYGIVQSIAPHLTGKKQGRIPGGREATLWAKALMFIPLLIAIAVQNSDLIAAQTETQWSSATSGILVVGLLIFGGLFAINSSLHSYLIVSYAKAEGVSLDIGFYYMANAMGRLIGTLLSGWLYLSFGLETCLYASTGMIAVAVLVSTQLPPATQKAD